MLSTETFFSRLTGAQRLAAFILVVAVAAALVAFLAGGWLTGVFVAALVLAILWVTRPLWKPAIHSSTKTRVLLTLLSVISGVALAIAGKAPDAKPILGRLLIQLGFHPDTAQKVAGSDHLTSALIFAFVLLGVALVNWFSRDLSAMQKHPRALDEDFPDQDYREQARRYAQILVTRLNTLDEEARWDDYFFAPLEAEVEVLSGRRSTKKIVDLVSALKADRTSRIVLVLGDPGAGKSIALRKLAKELIKESDHTGRLPVYVNLKEWAAEREWSREAPPDAAELRSFILRTLKSYSVFADQFLGKYFDRMLDRGRFFFLLDSFDEMPAVLDVSEDSWLIHHLSQLITEFFVSQDAGRGIVASRFYRRPKFNRVESATFEIRPFSDMRIHDALLRSQKLREETIDNLFTKRSELIPVARNPFSAALIRIYAENNGGSLPSSQLEMYESYIRGRLDASDEQTQRYGLTGDALMTGATKISLCMFQEPQVGLEAPVAQLAELLPDIPVGSIVAVLRYSGLARLSSGPDGKFSFVHRRLNEFFVARTFLRNPGSVTLNAIPSDSRYRDALALYCEVGDPVHVRHIADFCWMEITRARKEADVKEHLRAVHCLRFLRDAFRSRTDCISFVQQLAQYIDERIEPQGDLLAAKIALEAIGLLPENEAEPILVNALRTENPWISETALHSCRHLKRIGPTLNWRLFGYLRSIPIPDFLRRHREIVFSLSLSDAFERLRQYCTLRSYDNRIFVAAVVFCVMVSPLVALTIAVVYSVFYFISEKTLNAQVFARIFAASLIGGPALEFLFPSWNARVRHFLFPLLSPSPTSFKQMLLPGLSIAQGHGRTYVAACYLVIALALAPCLETIVVFYYLIWRRTGLARRLAVMAIGVVTSLAFGLIVSRLLERIMPWIMKHLFALAVLPVCIIIVLLLGHLTPALVGTYRDHKHLNASTRSTAVTRGSIATDFLSFRTEWYRFRYVEWLRDAQVHPVGAWPESRPNKGDGASTVLAQLDERWLGLEG